jgi:RND family efflux transporter MFP subunit
LQDTVELAGQIVPARTAQLSFRSAGTVRAVNVRSGQVVKKGEPLAELALDDAALIAAQTQATVAELAYQSQKTRLEELKRGAGSAALQEARANATRARAALVEAQVARDAARNGNSPARVDGQLAQLAVEQAKDDLENAQRMARRAQEAENSQTELAVRAAQRKVDEASIRLDILRARQGNAEAARALEQRRVQVQMEQAQDDYTRAQLAGQQAEEDNQNAAAAAAAAVRAAERQVLAATIRLEAASNPANLAATTPAAGNLEAERQLARQQLTEAQAQLGAAQAALRQAQAQAAVGATDQTSQATAPVIRIDAPTTDQRGGASVQPTAGPQALGPQALATRTADQGAVSNAVAGVRAAERAVAEASQRVEQLNRAIAQAAQAAPTPQPGQTPTPGVSAERQLAQLQLDAAKEELARAQATAEQVARRSQQSTQGGASPAALSARQAERKLEDTDLWRQQLELNNNRVPADAETRLAELTLAQAQDELAQAQTTAQLAAQRQTEAAEASASSTAYATRAAERKLAEATLRLQQARSTEQSAATNRDAQGDLPDLRVAAAEASVAAADARVRDLQSGSASAQAVQTEEQRTTLLEREALDARAGAQRVVVLTAPFDGTVTSVEVTPNQSVEAKATVLRLDDPGRLSILANVSEYDVTRLALDQRVDITLPGVTDQPMVGMVVDVSAAGVRQANGVTFPVRIDMDSVPAAVRVGMSASVTVNARQANDVLYVPVSAVRRQGDSASVFRVSPDGTVQEVPVVTGGIFGTNVVISSGLTDQDVVAQYGSRAPAQTVAAATGQLTGNCAPGC